MNCQEVEPALSEYLDKSLDAIRMKAVESHLLSCAVCRAEADGLIDCIQQIAELPLLDPPIGFAQRVMAHVREIETKPSLWRRVFTPPRTNAPIQATAVVFIAVLAVFVYQKESEIKNNESARLSTPVPPMSLSFDKPVSSNANPSAEPPRPAQPPTIEARAKSIAQKPSLKKETPATTQLPQLSVAAQPESTTGDVKDALSLSRRAPIQAQEVATGMENLRPSGDTFGLGPALGGSLRPGFFLPERALSPITEPSADVEFIVRRRDVQRRDQKESASSDLQRERAETGIAATAATAKQSSPAPSPQSPAMAVREVRWFTVPADRYDQFRKELVAEAAIESEKSIGAMEKDFALKTNRELLIKVIILSPADR